jgi:hypothetical protein
VSRWLGISDLISALWIGGLLASMSLWIINWMNKKKISFKWADEIIFASFYLMAIIPLWISGAIGSPLNTLFGADKIILGITAGTVVFIVTELSYENMKKKNNGRALFLFQKVVMPFAVLAVFSALMFLVGI